MRRCGYCGKDNQEAVAACEGCGTPLVPPVITEAQNTEGVPPVIKPVLTGSLATGIFGLMFGAQVMAGMIGGMIIMMVSGGVGTNAAEREQLGKTISSNPALTAACVIAGGLATIAGSLMFVRPALRDPSPVGAAWRVGSGKDIATGAVLGLGIALALTLILSPLARVMHPKAGPLTTMSMTPGISQITYVILAVILVPVPEELLFRGVMYGGYRQSLGAWKAAALSTAIFVAMHLSELVYFLPATLGIVGLALGALYMRLRSSAIGPAVAVHVAYNSVIACLALLSRGGPS